MHRRFRTAFLAAVLVSSAFGIASATPSDPAPSFSAEQVSGAGNVPTAEPLPAADEASIPEVAAQAAELARWSSGDGSALSPAMRRALKAAERNRAARDADPIHRLARGIVNRTSSIALSLTRNAMRFLGTPYVFGGTSPSGFDCSGYVQHVFAMLGIVLPRTADAQYYAGRRTVGGMKTGDLVFFETYLPGPSHVGIYLGSGKFVHSSGHGVMVSHLRDHYWSARYLGAKRVVAIR